ncbi:MAG: tetratricopeptide repeat protein, partial [Burkholderiales bacterium]
SLACCTSPMRVSVRTCAGVLCVLALFAEAAAGQPTREEGIRAVLRGDHQAAARVLRPLADDKAHPDAVAQFFLAILYETGQGVPRDMGRACSLFLRSGTGDHPFARQSAAIAAFMRHQMGDAASLICVAGERRQGRPTQSFALGPIIRSAGARAPSADGVIALARGDYQRAVEILKPIAEDRRSEDTAAQFFMAGLYEAGVGVPADPLRACALYARAVSQFENPFGRQAMPLFSTLAGRGREFDQECQLLASIGFDHGFEAASFELRPGHFVEWTLPAATVTYTGRTRRHEMASMQPGTHYLPLQHTELGTGPTRAVARHFVEMFVWLPTPSGPWQLQWHIFEIVRDDIIPVGVAEPLVTVDGDNPPSRETFNVREYAVLRVDDEGYPEWAVMKGPHPKTQRIESDAERRDVREASRARAAALKGIEWSRTYDVTRHPALTYTDADGCGQVEVYGWTADRAEAIVVRAAIPDIAPSAQSFNYDLARDPVTISIEARLYASPQHRFDSCSDVVLPVDPDSLETWRAVAGTVVIELSAPGVRARAPHLRRATVTLSDVVLRNTTGMTVKTPRAIRLIAIVGGFSG